MDISTKFSSRSAIMAVVFILFSMSLSMAQSSSPLSGIKSEVISSTQVKVSWEGSISDKAYEIRRRENNNSFWVYNTVTAPSTSRRFTNLKPATTYEWEVRIVGGKNDTFVPGGQFTTFSNCELPDDYTIHYSGLTGATLNWSYGNNIEKYAVRVKTVDEEAWKTYYTDYTSLTLNGLQPYTEYEWQVSSYCSATSEMGSAFSTSQYFSTESYLQLGLNQVMINRKNLLKKTSPTILSSTQSGTNSNNLVRMINTLGQTVKQFPISYTDSSGDLFIDINNEPPAGIYFMKAPSGMNISGQKVLVK